MRTKIVLSGIRPSKIPAQFNAALAKSERGDLSGTQPPKIPALFNAALAKSGRGDLSGTRTLKVPATAVGKGAAK